MNITIALLVLMVIAALWSVMSRSLLKGTIGLALTSAVITILMFRMNAPLAAVFELSVCTGLITVVFVSTISLTKPLTHKEITQLSADRIKRYWYLPVIVLVAAAAMAFIRIPKDCVPLKAQALANDVRIILWNLRQLDLFGQIIVIIIGALGVVILFEERRRDEW